MSTEIAEAYVRIRPDLTGFREELRAELEAATAADGKVRIDGDDAPLLDKIAAGVAAGDAARVTIPVDADVAPAMASIAELKAATKMMGMPRSWLNAVAITRGGISNPQDYATKAALIEALAQAGSGGSGGGGGGGGGGGVLAGLLAGEAGKGGGGGGLMSLLGFGAGAGWLGLAGFGSIGSLAGLGPEHLIMTALGLAGSAAGGLLGGGLLAGGSLATMGVGMGTDLAGIGQAAGDIKTVNTDLSNLDKAVALYGKNSQQAAVAQRQLNYDLSSFSPVARTAVLAAAQTAQQFRTIFDQFTGPAENIGAQIITQLMTVAEKFLPTIGAFATENMGIIRSGLQPLLAWIQGTGLSIFTNLESKFSGELPTAVHAFDEAVELVVRTFANAASYTGPFLQSLDRFFTKWNSDAGFASWSTTIGHLVGDFRAWEGLVKILGADIYQLFHHDAGTASGIVASLTQMLTKLHEWETSVSGGAALHNVFEAHREEVLQLLQLLPPLVESFGRIEMVTAPVLTRLLADILGVVNAILRIPDAGRFIGLAAGIALMASKFGILMPLLRASGMMTLGQSLLGPVANGFRGLLTLIPGVTTEMVGFDAAADANPIGLIVIALAALGAALYELVTHFKTVSDFLRGPWGYAIAAAATMVNPLLGVAVLLIGHWRAVLDFFTTSVPSAFGAVERFFEELPSGIVDALSKLPGLLEQAAKDALTLMLQGFEWGTALLIAAAIKVPVLVGNALAALPGLLYQLAADAWRMFLSATETAAGAVWSFVSSVPGRILGLLSSLPGLLAGSGSSMITGFLHAAYGAALAVWSWLSDIPGAIEGFFKGADSWLYQAGRDVIQGLISGIESMGGGVLHAIENVTSGITGKVESLLGIHSPSTVMAALGVNIGEGLALGIDQSGALVTASVVGLASRVAAPFSSSVAFSAAGVGSIKGAGSVSYQGGPVSLTFAAGTSAADAGAIRAAVAAAMDQHDRQLLAEIGQQIGVSR